MRVAFLIPGSGDTFYCENCVRDYNFTGALEKQGIELFQIPLYLPLFSYSASLTRSPVFYGAISLYLTHKLPILSRLPGFIKKLFNARPLLRLAARMAGTTRAKDLETLTISMLKGEQGKQREELEKLILYLKNKVKPDLVHISNALLLGLSRRLKSELNVPLICSLQDEHTWVDVMKPSSAREVWLLLKNKAQYVDRFIAVSHFYQKLMAERLALPASKIDVVYNGVHTVLYKQAGLDFNPPVLGFLSRISATTGFDTLVEAFIRLKLKPPLARLKLYATGGYNHDDKTCIRRIMRKLKKHGFLKDIKIITPFDPMMRFDFLSSLSLLSVPLPFPEAFGIFIIEALANGVPVVVPESGAFSEIIKATGGGVTYDPANFEALVQNLEKILKNKSHAQKLGRTGRKNIIKNFNLDTMASQIVKVYKKCLRR